MNILVIGNGFDLAHGLPTEYKDFLEFAKVIYQIVEINDFNSSVEHRMLSHELVKLIKKK